MIPHRLLRFCLLSIIFTVNTAIPLAGRASNKVLLANGKLYHGAPKPESTSSPLLWVDSLNNFRGVNVENSAGDDAPTSELDHKLNAEELTSVRVKRGVVTSNTHSKNRTSSFASGSRKKGKFMSSTFSRSNSLPNLGSSFSNEFRTSSINRQPQPIKPLFGTDRNNNFPAFPVPSNSQLPSFNPTVSPGSRRNSFGLEDEFSLLSTNTKRPSQLQRIDSWEKREINSAGLNDNCYYCTAAGLAGKTTDRMVQTSGTMQNRFGTVGDTKTLLQNSYFPNTQSRVFQNSLEMGSYFNDRLQEGTAEKFGVAYTTPRPLFSNPNVPSADGHMVAMKAWKTPTGSIGTRKVDFQLHPEDRFTPDSYNWSPPGSFHLIDLNPPKPMEFWTPTPPSPQFQFKRRPSNQLVEGYAHDSKRVRTAGFSQ